MRTLLAASALLAFAFAGCSEQDGGTGSSTISSTGPPDNTFRLQEVLDGLADPVYVTHAGDGSGRLFVVEQGASEAGLRGGRVLVWDGTGDPEVFLDLTGTAGGGGERGVLGLAFHPSYESNGRFWVHYTAAGSGTSTVAEYRVGSDPDRADSGSAKTVLQVAQPFPNHNGGMIEFGPDGYLYVALGDGGSGGDPQRNGQNKDALLGKILRLDVSIPPGTPLSPGYTTPGTNPFVGKAGRDEVWAYGLRNPWRFSFDRETGDLWIADVGQNNWEEIDFQPASSKGGENYGWCAWEGAHRYSTCDNVTGTVMPIFEYGHSGDRCSITGGYVYRGAELPHLDGAYFFADYCSGEVWVLREEGGAWVSHEGDGVGGMVSSFGQDEDGELYVVDHTGAVYKIVPA
jgi:glucose/arabinose dehydrogenase